MPEPRNDELGEYREYLMMLARSQVSVDLRGRIDPSDLVQETLCDALRDLPRHRGRTRAEMMAWLPSLLKFNPKFQTVFRRKSAESKWLTSISTRKCSH